MSMSGVRTAVPAARTSTAGLAGEGRGDLEVVDHQVQDDVHVEAPRREHAQAMHLEEAGSGTSARAASTAGL